MEYSMQLAIKNSHSWWKALVILLLTVLTDGAPSAMHRPQTTPMQWCSLMKPVQVINDCAASNTKCAVVICGCGWYELWKLTHGVK